MFDPAPIIITTPTRIWEDWVEPKHDAASMLTIAQAMIAHPDNWCQGALYENGKVCAVGAMIYASGLSINDSVVRKHLDMDCDSHPGLITVGIPGFDHLHRVALAEMDWPRSADGWAPIIDINDMEQGEGAHEDVIDLYDKAIQRAMEKP